MSATPVGGKKSSTRQEVFVCLSILIFSCLWLPLCIEKYTNGEASAGLYILLFSFLSSITGCSLFLVAITCELKGYQKAAPILLLLAIVIGIVGTFVFADGFCNAFFASNDYGYCFAAECFSFLIYILTSYYLISMILARTNFKIGLSDLDAIKKIFGSRARVRILLLVNVSMLIVIFIDMRIYSYSLMFNKFDFNNLDVLWLSICSILSVISILITLMLLRFQMCIPYIAHKWLLTILIIITFMAFGIGFITVWKYRFSDLDGMAQIGNVFIWSVVNLWMLVEFMTTDINVIMKQTVEYTNVAQTDQEVSETDENDPML
eukprot:265237_1